MALDEDEKLENTCHKCKTDMSTKKCIRCGKPLGDVETFVNPNFDRERFERLKNGK